MPSRSLNHFYQSIQGWFDYEDLYSYVVRHIHNQYRTEEDMYVEVGSWKGRSAAYLAIELLRQYDERPVKLYCVDHWEGISDEALNVDNPYEFFWENMRPVWDVVTAIRGHSHEMAGHFEDNTVRFVFIDADHTYEAVKMDILAWLPKVCDDGILAGHDLTDKNFPGVRKAVEELLPEAKQYGKSCWIVYPEDIPGAKQRLLGLK